MQSRYAKLVVKDGSGNFIQLLPETKVDGSINPNSSNPPSGAAVAAWGGTFVSKTGNEAVSGQKTFAEGPYGTSAALSGTSIDLSAGSVFTKTISANTTFSISNAPTGKASQFILILENGGAYTVTWPNSVVWAGGDAPALAESGKNVLRFVTPNGDLVERRRLHLLMSSRLPPIRPILTMEALSSGTLALPRMLRSLYTLLATRPFQASRHSLQASLAAPLQCREMQSTVLQERASQRL